MTAMTLMTAPGFSPSCRHELYRAQARCACARRGICLAADRFAATNRPTQSGTAASPQSPRGLGPRSRSHAPFDEPTGLITARCAHAGAHGRNVPLAPFAGWPPLAAGRRGSRTTAARSTNRVAALRGCKMYECTHERAFGTFAAPFDLALRGLLADCCAASAT